MPEPGVRQAAPPAERPACPVLAQAPEADGGAETPGAASPAATGKGAGERVAARRPERVVRLENGRYIIETTLVESGTRATWIVDPTLRLADSSAGS